MAVHNCPYCRCENCLHQRLEERVIWLRGIDADSRYPGLFQPASKHISHVTRRNDGAESFYVDFVEDEEEKSLDYALAQTKTPLKQQQHTNPHKQRINQPLPQQQNRSNYQQYNQNKQHNADSKKALTELTEKQKRQIVAICKRHNNHYALGGLILADGTVTVKKNLAGNHPKTFDFKWKNKDAVGFWHRHQQTAGHKPYIGEDDKRIACETGMSAYMVYELSPNYSSSKYADDFVGQDCYAPDGRRYLFDQFHPNGNKNKNPIRYFRICFVCPTEEQLKLEIERANRYIKEDNENFRQEVQATQERITKKQAETQAKVTGAVAAINDAQTRVELLQNKYQLVARNYQQLPGKVNQLLLPSGDNNNAVSLQLIQKSRLLRV